ncbi:MAG: flagellar export protein FliJ [Phycisphaerales bacterium]|nr:flagellar export protein FliJ [Phycisphaerales bacterium]
MARFRFPLQAVLDLREREEQEQQRAVAEVESERRELERRLAEFQRAISGCKAHLRQTLGPGHGAVNTGAARLQMNASIHMQAQAQAVVLQLAGVHRRLERARAGLREASRRRKAIELLRDRREAAWRDALQRREASELDEMAVMRAGRDADGSLKT